MADSRTRLTTWELNQMLFYTLCEDVTSKTITFRKLNVMSKCASSFGCIELGVFSDLTSELVLFVLATQPINSG